MLPLCSEQALSQLLVRKEEEWRELQAHRAQLQEAALHAAQSRLEEAQARLQRLQEDFVYNLQVLEERDQELEHYDALFTQARAQEEARQAETSELRIQVAKLKQALAREARRVEELQQQQQLRMQEHRLELERIHSEKNSELDQQQEQYENLKWRLERKLEEVDGELALQKQELLLEFGAEMQKREHEFRLKADDMSSVVLSHELKVKFLNKELEALKEAGAQAAECLQRAETVNAELESRLQGRTWELRDLEAVKDARIKELEDELHSVQVARKKEEETFQRKYEELDRLVREKDTVLASVKGTHREQQQAQKTRVAELQAQCETLEGQLRKAERAQAAAVREKGAVVDRLREEVAALEAGRDAQMAQMAKDVIARDLQLQALQEGEEKLQAQLARFQQDIDRYKQQLTLAVERERSLEREQVQLGLDWQRRCDSVERDQIQKSEALIQGLTEARDQVAAKLQEAERALREQELVLRTVTLERDQAREALRGSGPYPGLEVQVPVPQHDGDTSQAFPSAEIQQLREQNTSLRHAVSQMRREMEALSNQIPLSAQLGENPVANPPDPGAGGDPARPDYILALEAEIQSLQCKFQSLEEQLISVPEPSVPSQGPVAHTETTGGALPALTGLALRKLRDRVHLLDLLVTELKKKVQVQKRPLKLGLLPLVDQVHVEVQELQTQVAELELHLKRAGQEGGRPWEPQGTEDAQAVGPEERGPFPMNHQPGVQTPPPLPTSHLQQKLEEATRKILRLCLEKEQLIEMGNRLRAELGQAKGKPRPRPASPTREPLDPGAASEMPVRPAPPLGELQPHGTQVTCLCPALNSPWFVLASWEPWPTGPGRELLRLKREASRVGLEARPPTENLHGGAVSKGPPGMEQWRPCHPVCTQQARPSPEARVLMDLKALEPKGPKGMKKKTSADPAGKKQPCPVQTVTCQKENRSPGTPRAQGIPGENSQHTRRSSSLASSSLQDTWRLLDLGSSPAGLPSEEGSTPEPPALPAACCPHKTNRSLTALQGTFAIQGTKVATQSRAQPARPARPPPARCKHCQHPPTIRNYSLKD
ncbi:coiled-coil domain-containing protein 57 [Thomomys bottae]